MLKLNSVMIGSENPTKLAEFFTKIFGKPVWEDNGFSGWLAGDSYLGVGPHSEVKGKNTSPGRIMWHFETDDVKGEFDRLKSLGAEVIAEPYNPGGDGGMLLATLADPDGNYFQLATPWKAS